MTLGQRIHTKIHNKMIKKGITRQQLADIIGKKRTALNRNMSSLYLHNQGSVRTISEICSALDMQLVVFEDDEGNKKIEIEDKG